MIENLSVEEPQKGCSVILEFLQSEEIKDIFSVLNGSYNWEEFIKLLTRFSKGKIFLTKEEKRFLDGFLNMRFDLIFNVKTEEEKQKHEKIFGWKKGIFFSFKRKDNFFQYIRDILSRKDLVVLDGIAILEKSGKNCLINGGQSAYFPDNVDKNYKPTYFQELTDFNNWYAVGVIENKYYIIDESLNVIEIKDLDIKLLNFSFKESRRIRFKIESVEIVDGEILKLNISQTHSSSYQSSYPFLKSFLESAPSYINVVDLKLPLMEDLCQSINKEKLPIRLIELSEVQKNEEIKDFFKENLRYEEDSELTEKTLNRLNIKTVWDLDWIILSDIVIQEAEKRLLYKIIKEETRKLLDERNKEEEQRLLVQKTLSTEKEQKSQPISLDEQIQSRFIYNIISVLYELWYIDLSNYKESL